MTLPLHGRRILVLIPQRGFDPTEAAVPFVVLTKQYGATFVFAVADPTLAAACDPIMITGDGLGLLKWTMRADENGREAYAELVASRLLLPPNTISYAAALASVEAFDALLLPGGHCPDMRPYLESALCHQIVAAFDAKKTTAANPPAAAPSSSGEGAAAAPPSTSQSTNTIGAVCHGVVLAGRAGILRQRRVTALEWWMEGLAWNLTRLWMGDYYKTYPDTSVQAEVTGQCKEFVQGPKGFARDSPTVLRNGFCVRDGSLVTARWPGDCHAFAHQVARVVLEAR